MSELKQSIIDHFGSDFTPFYSRFLENLKPGSAGNLRARCPFHDDTTPSLSICIQDGLWNCRGCGLKGDVFDFFGKKEGLHARKQFPEVLRAMAEAFGIQGGNGTGKASGAQRRIVATYDYRDAAGSVVFRKLRYEPKSFSLCRPDGKGGWVNGKGDVEPVLYRLPEVLAADEVWIVEGEKDADRLAELRITATTNFDGAGKWRPSYSEALAGKLVIVVPDCDEPGRRHAELVASSLHGRAAYVSVAELPGLQPGGDVSDLIEAAGNSVRAAEQLVELAEGARPWTPKADADPAIEACTPELPATRPDLIAFPENVMTGAAGNFAALYSQHLEPPPAFFYMSFLTCLGWAISNRVSLDSEIRTPARLFTLLLGESADDRKSTAIDKTADFFAEAIEGFAICRGVGSAEGLQKLFQEKPHLLLCFDEFKQFVSKCRIEASVLLPLVNSLFEGHRFEAHTKTVKINIENAGLSLLAASTTDTYQQTWSQTFTDIGFNNRLFLVVGKGCRKFAFPRPIPEVDKIVIHNELRDVLRFVGAGRRIGITPDAEARFQEWYLERESSVHTKRLDGYALRLMQLLAVNELKEMIDLETVEKVLALCDWQLTVRKLNDPIGADNVVVRLENNIRRQLEVRGAMTEAALHKWTHASTHGYFYFGCALANLEKAGIVERSKRGQKTVFAMADPTETE